MPELPYDKRNRYETQLGLSARDANILTSNQVVNDFFEECLKLKNEPKFVGNWVQTDIMRKLKDSLLDEPVITISPKNFVELITMFQNNEISINNARELLDRIWDTDESAVKLARTWIKASK